ncbi:MAG: restriction endonuclease subunit M [Neisseriaceae bacterium]|nr:restriction endonuclease subunit M [Neisseriaceae bacterium]
MPPPPRQSYLEQGLQAGIITLHSDKTRISYFGNNKSRNYQNPEEPVQAETFCELILKYGYPKNRVKCFVPVQMGSSQKEADIVVYADDDCLQPFIVIECKESEVSEAEFQQAVEQAYSYAFALPNNVKWVWVTSSIKNAYLKVDKNRNTREEVTDIPIYGSDKVAPYKFVKNAEKFNENNDKQRFFDLQIVEEKQLTDRFKLAHNALWAGGELNPSEAFDELDKLIFCKIWDEKKPRKAGEPYDFQVIADKTSEKTNQALFNRICALYEEGRKKDPEVFKNNINLTPARVRTIVEYLQDVNLSDTDLDSKGRAFETFMGSFFRGDFGQFFTPRAVVQFIVDCLPIKNDSFVLDTSCGSGGFLLHALEKVRRQADDYFDNPNSKEHYRYWHDFAEKHLYGIEINGQISRAAKMNMIIHDDGHTNVITADGLKSDTVLREESNHTWTGEYGKFDFILTNPPFGSSVKQTEKAYLHQYRLGQSDVSWLDLKNTGVKNRDSQKTEILFLEQCHHFLKENGFLAIVIPDGILTNSSLQYVRDELEDWYRIVAVVSLPQTAFSATGAGVKSSVLFLRKYPARYTAKLIAIKEKLQDKILQKENYANQIKQMEQSKKQALDKPEIPFSGSLKEFKRGCIRLAQKIVKFHTIFAMF